SSIKIDEPQVQQSDHYCEVQAKLSFIGSIASIPIYTAENKSFNSPFIEEFVHLLKLISHCFSLNTFQIFIDPDTVTVAFNQSGSLFFNYSYYHRQKESNQSLIEIYSSWYFTMCHELAHNIESNHNS